MVVVEVVEASEEEIFVEKEVEKLKFGFSVELFMYGCVEKVEEFCVPIKIK